MKTKTTLALVTIGVALGLGLSACAAPNSAPDPKTIAGRRLIKQATEQAAAAQDRPAQAIQVATTAPTVAPMATDMATAVPEATTAPLVQMVAPSEAAGDSFGAEFDFYLAQAVPYCLAAFIQIVFIVLASLTSPRQDMAAGCLIMGIATVAAGSSGLAMFGVGGGPGVMGALFATALGIVAGGCLFGRWKVRFINGQ